MYEVGRRPCVRCGVGVVVMLGWLASCGQSASPKGDPNAPDAAVPRGPTDGAPGPVDDNRDTGASYDTAVSSTDAAKGAVDGAVGSAGLDTRSTDRAETGLIAGACPPMDPVGLPGTYVPAQYSVACGTRDGFLWPFAKNSIWNMPIGSEARYVDCNLGVMGACNVDNDFVLREQAKDPAHPVIRHDHLYGTDGKGNTGKVVHIPDAFTYKGGPNNGAAFLDVNGHTWKEFSAFARETPASDPVAWDFGTNESDSQGIVGGHAGGGMSVLGGTLRPGELTGTEPIRHVLKVEFDWAVLSADWTGKFRWPARNSDGNGKNNYGGKVKALTMGSLVALRPDVNLDGITWKTPFGKKIAKAFQDYGAYVVDTTGNYWKWGNGGYTMAVCAQNESIDEVKTKFGIDFRSGWGGGGAGWTADMSEIYKRLAVVDNNSATSIGGGGLPRQPLAPDINK